MSGDDEDAVEVKTRRERALKLRNGGATFEDIIARGLYPPGTTVGQVAADVRAAIAERARDGYQ